MANQKLSPDKLKALQQDIMKGESPTDIANKYKVSKLNVQYHKKKLREQGLELPDQRLKQPTKTTKVNTVSTAKQPTVAKNTQVVINGIGITFHNKKADVKIFDNKIEIKY